MTNRTSAIRRWHKPTCADWPECFTVISNRMIITSFSPKKSQKILKIVAWCERSTPHTKTYQYVGHYTSEYVQSYYIN